MRMHKMKKRFALIIAAALTLVMLSGCSTESGLTETKSVTASNATAQTEQAKKNATYVKVQSIDGSAITAISGLLTQPGDRPEDSGQQMIPNNPPDGDSQAAPPDMPSGGNFQQNAPDEQGGTSTQGDRAGFTAGDAIITFSVNDATKIEKQSRSETTEATLNDIIVGDILEVTISDNGIAESIVIQSSGNMPGDAGQSGQPGSNFGGSDTVTNGTAVTTIDTEMTINGQSYTSGGDDENALRIDGAVVTLDGITVNKTGGASSNTENGDFYGMNAGLLALNGATVVVSGATVTTNAVNGNGVFSYGAGTTVNISDSVIRTYLNNSGGIQTTGGATMNATDLDVETNGNSAAAIRTDRGDGDVNVAGGTYVTNGTGSPAIYCTADITVENAVLTSNASEAVVVEGKNSVTLNNVTLTGNMQPGMDENENVQNIMLYQSMSGDAEVGHSSFTATGGNILAKAGDMFYVTNTTCTISLTDVALTLAEGNLLTVAGNSSSRGWGTAGKNGGICTFAISRQILSGEISVDDISSLDFQLSDGSVYTGAINPSGTAGKVSVMLGNDSQWILTGDSYINSFTGDVSSIATNGYTLFVNGTAITVG